MGNGQSLSPKASHLTSMSDLAKPAPMPRHLVQRTVVAVRSRNDARRPRATRAHPPVAEVHFDADEQITEPRPNSKEIAGRLKWQ
jgi:hypothetical protein